MPIDQQFSGDFEERIVSSRTLGNEEETEYKSGLAMYSLSIVSILLTVLDSIFKLCLRFLAVVVALIFACVQPTKNVVASIKLVIHKKIFFIFPPFLVVC